MFKIKLELAYLKNDIAVIRFVWLMCWKYDMLGKYL